MEIFRQKLSVLENLSPFLIGNDALSTTDHQELFCCGPLYGLFGFWWPLIGPESNYI